MLPSNFCQEQNRTEHDQGFSICFTIKNVLNSLCIAFNFQNNLIVLIYSKFALCNCNTRSYYHYVFETLSIRYIFLMWISQIFRTERKAMQTKKIKRKEELERLAIYCRNFHAILRYIYIYMYAYVSTSRWEQSSKVNYYEN